VLTVKIYNDFPHFPEFSGDFSWDFGGGCMNFLRNSEKKSSQGNTTNDGQEVGIEIPMSSVLIWDNS
jgi:hypothetical protein